MTDQKVLFSALCFSFVFESLNSYTFGFYILPSVLIALCLVLLPFSVALFNFFIAWVFGAAVFEFWALFFNNLIWPSLGFFLHIFIYLSLLLAFLYIVYGPDKKQE